MGNGLVAHSAFRTMSPRGYWVIVGPVLIAPEDLETQAVHRTCCWTLGTGAGGTDPWPTLLLVHAHHDPRLNGTQVHLHCGKGVGELVKVGRGLGRKAFRLESRRSCRKQTNKQTNETCQALLQVLGDPNVLVFQDRLEFYHVSFALELTVFWRFKTH